MCNDVMDAATINNWISNTTKTANLVESHARMRSAPRKHDGEHAGRSRPWH